MGKLDSLRIIDPLLTTIARGYSNDQYIGDKLFPVVTVDKEGGKIPLFGKESFKLWNTERALRADSNEMDGSWLTQTSFALTEHDIQQRLDYREIAEAMLALEAQAAQNVMDQILLGYEKEQADLVQDTNTYPTDNKVTMTDDYLNEAAIDFVEFIHLKKAALGNIIAKEPNTMVLPKKVWNKLKFHPKLKSYITVNQDMYQAVASIQKLQEILEIENILIGSSMYSEDGNTFDQVWGNNIVLAYIKPASGIDRTPYEPCFGYTLRKSGFPYSDKYESNGGKIKIVRATDNYAIKVVGSESAYLIKNPIDPALF